MRGLEWMTPQGKKTMRAGDHQAIHPMYVVRITDGQFKIVGTVGGDEAFGADECKRGLIQRVFNTPDRHVTTLLLTLGLGLVIEEALKVVFGPNTQRPPTPIAGAVEVMGIILPTYRLFPIIIGGAIVAAVAVVVNKTRLGAIVRATVFDRNMAASLGVPVTRVFAGTFAFGVTLAGLAGVLLAPIYSVFPTMGRDLIFLAFTVVIVGGM